MRTSGCHTPLFTLHAWLLIQASATREAGEEVGGGGGGRTEVVQIKDRLRPPGEAIGDEQVIKESSRALMPEVRPGDL